MTRQSQTHHMNSLRRFSSDKFPSSLLLKKVSDIPQNLDTPPSISSLLKACKTHKHLETIHARIIQNGLEQDNFIINQFISQCYNIFSNIKYATGVFERVNAPNIYLWNNILKGHCDNSSLFITIVLFKCLKSSAIVLPDKYTFPSLIKVCSNELALREGTVIHGCVVRCGFESDVFVGTSLIDLYGKCKEIVCARKVFDQMCDTSEVTWTAMMVGYLNFGDLEGAKVIFDEMPKRVIGSWNAMVCGYVKFGDLVNARKIFDEMGNRNVVSFTLLIDGYAKSGDMASARFLFEQAPKVDLVAWSALISGYVQNGQPNEAVRIFAMMQDKNVRPDEFIVVSLMSACSQIGNLQLAKWVDSYVATCSIDLQRAHVVSALIDMNAKCGNMERAGSLFQKMPKKDLISYCSMIQGFSMHGRGVEAVQLFGQMLEEGLIPDSVAFTVILTACSHAGFVEEGCRYFNLMKNDYCIVPSADHFACIVDLLGRAGQLEAAHEIIKCMPVEPNAGAWGALLGACKLHGNTELGNIVAGRLFEVEPNNAGNYVLLSNIYAAADQWSDVAEVRDRMRERGLQKKPGCSWI